MQWLCPISVLGRVCVGWCHTHGCHLFLQAWGGRKLRFDVRKNQERTNLTARKSGTPLPVQAVPPPYNGPPLVVSVPLDVVQPSSSDDVLPLVVSIPLDLLPAMKCIVSLPLSAYTSCTAPNGRVLCSRLSKSRMLPPGWTEASVPLDCSSHSLVLYKPRCLPPLFTPQITFSLQITQQCTWTLSIGSSPLTPQHCLLVSDIQEKLSSVDEVVGALSTLDSSKFCVGNGDTKFLQLADQHKGSFKDKSGMLL